MGEAGLPGDEVPVEHLEARAGLDGASRRFSAALDELTGERDLSRWREVLEVPVREVHAAHAVLLVTAPESATSWWPGAWICEVDDSDPGVFAPLTGTLWRTADEAFHARPRWVAEQVWRVRWVSVRLSPSGALIGALARYACAEPLALDADFWQWWKPRPVARREERRPEFLEDVARRAGVTGAHSSLVVSLGEAAQWVGMAVASGVLGNLSYDVAKMGYRRLVRPATAAEEDQVSPPTRKPTGTSGERLKIDLPPGVPPVLGIDANDP